MNGDGSTDAILRHIRPEDGVLLAPVPAAEHAERADGFDWAKAIVNAAAAKQKLIELAPEAAQFGRKRRGWKANVATGTQLFFLTHAAAFKAAVAWALPMTKGTPDEVVVSRMSTTISAALSCGGFVVTVLTVPATAGISGVVAVASAASCAKSVVELVSVWKTGKSWFESSRATQAFGLSLDAASLLGGALGLGREALAHAGQAPTLMKSLAAVLTRGSGVSTVGRVGVGLDTVNVLLDGVKWVIQASPAGPMVVRATPELVRQALDEAGLRRMSCFFPWPLQTSGLGGPCPGPFTVDPGRMIYGR